MLDMYSDQYSVKRKCFQLQTLTTHQIKHNKFQLSALAQTKCQSKTNPTDQTPKDRRSRPKNKTDGTREKKNTTYKLCNMSWHFLRVMRRDRCCEPIFFIAQSSSFFHSFMLPRFFLGGQPAAVPHACAYRTHAQTNTPRHLSQSSSQQHAARSFLLSVSLLCIGDWRGRIWVCASLVSSNGVFFSLRVRFFFVRLSFHSATVW